MNKEFTYEHIFKILVINKMTTVIHLQKKGLNLSGFASNFFDLLAGNSAVTVTEAARFDAEKVR